jgi:hypothetical protein
MYVWKSMIHLTQLAPMMVLNSPASALPGSPAALGLAHLFRNRMNDQLPHSLPILLPYRTPPWREPNWVLQQGRYIDPKYLSISIPADNYLPCVYEELLRMYPFRSSLLNLQSIVRAMFLPTHQ